MDWLTSWLTSHEHWKWLSPPSLLAAMATWLSHRRGRSPWLAFTRQFNLNRELAICAQDRDNERRSKEFAMAALRELAEAGSVVAKAMAEGQPTSSGRSSRGPRRSPPPSTGSHPTRKPGPPDLP
jgi:hypothetical protein